MSPFCLTLQTRTLLLKIINTFKGGSDLESSHCIDALRSPGFVRALILKRGSWSPASAFPLNPTQPQSVRAPPPESPRPSPDMSAPSLRDCQVSLRASCLEEVATPPC